VDQLSKGAREYLLYLEDGRLLISKTHQFKPEVTGFIARLKRLNMPYLPHYVELSVLMEMQESLGGKVGEQQATSDMQRQAKRIFDKAVVLRASDIHIRNTRQKKTSILMRVHGDLEHVEEHTYEWGDQLCATIYQAMTDISDSTFEPLSHQDARISDKIRLPTGVDGIRVATTPQVDGYVMVLRLLYNDTVESFDLSLLGYLPDQITAVNLMKRRPTGINIIAGPTGSGKSTTLQRVLGAIIKETAGRKHVITVEDPPEYPIPGAVQTPVTNADTSEERSRAFQASIRAAMRLDPDIIMIGEIRDTPSAKLAIQAAMTGHQVWSTLHANNAFAILDRLLDLEVPLEMLTDHSIITGLTCQRLVKLLCPKCKVPLIDAMDRYSETEMRRIKSVVDLSTVFVIGEGCEHCRKSGTVGRTVVAETITTDARLMTFIRNRDRIGAMEYWKRDQYGQTMLGHAIQIVKDGLTDPFSAEDVVGPLNMDAINSDHRIDTQELRHAFVPA
jgi:type II secretory ATPase GspE/PulE/Tfp pilus assembly ATPase PilB-like protein